MIKWENYEQEENEIILRFDGMIEHKKSYEFQENSTQSKKHKIPRRWNDQKWKTNKQMNWRID